MFCVETRRRNESYAKVVTLPSGFLTNGCGLRVAFGWPLNRNQPWSLALSG